MPERLTWSPPRDLQMRRMRIEGASWDEIATELRLSRRCVIERGRIFGVLKRAADEPPAPDGGRAPLPAGHHASWGALTAETTLRGQTYPWPPLAHEV